MNAPGLGKHVRGQRVEIGALELRELAEFQNVASDRVLLGQRLEHLRLRRAAAALGGAAAGRQFEPVEQHFRELLRRVDVEARSRLLVDLCLQLVDRLGKRRGQLGEVRRIDPHAAQLHPGENLRQRQFDGVEQLPQSRLRLEFGLERQRQLQNDVGLLCRIAPGFLDRNEVEGRLLVRQDVCQRRHLQAQHVEGQLMEGVRLPGGVEHVGGQHRVEIGGDGVESVPRQRDQRSLDVVPDHLDGLVVENRAEHLQARADVGRVRGRQTLMSDRQIGCLPGLEGDSQPHDVGADGIGMVTVNG